MRNGLLFSFYFIITALISLAPSVAMASDPDETYYCKPCPLASPSDPPCNSPCPVSPVNSFVNLTKGLLGDDIEIFKTNNENEEGLALSLHYSVDNASGTSGRGQLDSGIGFGWRHSYDIYLLNRGSYLLRLSPVGLISKYDKSRDGSFSAIKGTQQTIRKTADGAFEITQRKGGTTYRFETLVGNLIRILGQNPYVLTSITDRNGNITKLDYQNGLLAKVTDTYGRQINYEYNGSKHLVKITDPLNRATSFEYDSRNNLTKITDPLGASIEFSYYGSHQISKKIHKNGTFSKYFYDDQSHIIAVNDQLNTPLLKLSNPIKWARNVPPFQPRIRRYIPSVTTKIDGNGKQWQYFYNAQAQFTKEVTPNNLVTSYTYDPATFNMASKTDTNGHTTRYENDPFGNITKQTDANGNVTLNEYNNPFNFVTKTSIYARGENTPYSVTTFTYDNRGNLIREVRDVGGLNLLRTWTYDNKGHVTSETDPNGHLTRYDYDANGNRTKVVDAEDKVTQFAYDTLGNKTSMTDGNGNIWRYGPYDGMDRLLAETDPLGHVTRYQYDGDGNKTEVKKQVSFKPDVFQTIQFIYDHRNRLISEARDPGGLNFVTHYAYDNNNNRIQQTDPRGNITQYKYGLQNRLFQITDALNHSTITRFDGEGNRRCIIDANKHVTFIDYDALNRPIRESKKIGAQTCTTGDADDLITQTFYDDAATIAQADCLNSQCGAPIPGSSQITHSIDPEGKHSYFKYDHANRKVMAIRKVGDTTDDFDNNGADKDWSEIAQYDGVGNLLNHTDANGNTNTYSYLANNWRKSEANALGETTSYTYNNAGKVKTIHSPGGNITTNAYNNRNELVQVSDLEGAVAGSDPLAKPGYGYDGIGNKVKTCDGNDHCQQYTYDAANRLIAQTDALGETSQHSYDKAGNLVKTTDREGHAQCHAYDNINRRTLNVKKVGDTNCSVVDGNDVWDKTAYDAVGNIIALTTAKTVNSGRPSTCTSASPPDDCETTRYVYDEVNRLVQEAYPRRDASDTRKNTREYRYDKASNLLQRVDHKNLATSYAYNDLYYLTHRDYQADTDDSFSYDVGGRLLTAKRGTWLDKFSYDEANRLLQAEQNGKRVDYSYDIPNRRRTLTYPGGKIVTEDRDLRERLSDIDSGATASYEYDPGNRVLNRSYGNGTAATYSYNDNNWLTNLAHTKTGGELIAGFGYEHDKQGNKRFEEKQHDPQKSEGFAYDDLYRLIHYKVGELDNAGLISLPLTQTQYDLDKLGNWDKKTKDGTTETRAHNSVNEITQINGDVLQHDDNGNLSQDSQYTYSYDQENRLTKATFVGAAGIETAGEYRYDALGRRIAKKTGLSRGNQDIRYFYDAARIIEEQGPFGVTKAAYTYGNYVDEVLTMTRNSKTYFYHQNSLYSVEAITDSLAKVVERVAYDAYGHPSVTNAAGLLLTHKWGTARSAIGNPWLFTGRQLDEEDGLYFYRARYYDTGKGRFLQRDPLEYVDGMSLYLGYFVPNMVDPSGTEGVAFTDCDFKTGKTFFVVGNEALYKQYPKCLQDCIKLHESIHQKQLSSLCKSLSNKRKNGDIGGTQADKAWTAFVYKNYAKNEGEAYKASDKCINELLESFLPREIYKKDCYGTTIIYVIPIPKEGCSKKDVFKYGPGLLGTNEKINKFGRIKGSDSID